VLTRVQNEALRYRRLEKALDGNDILSMGKQLLSNEQLGDLLRAICKPVSKEEMNKILKKSVFDPEMYTFFRQTSVIQKNFSLYRNWCETYHRQYIARLLMIVDDTNDKST
jgi:hypothetical protein